MATQPPCADNLLLLISWNVRCEYARLDHELAQWARLFCGLVSAQGHLQTHIKRICKKFICRRYAIRMYTIEMIWNNYRIGQIVWNVNWVPLFTMFVWVWKLRFLCIMLLIVYLHNKIVNTRERKYMIAGCDYWLGRVEEATKHVSNLGSQWKSMIYWIAD